MSDYQDRQMRRDIENWQPAEMPEGWTPGPDDPRIPTDKRRKRPKRRRPTIDPGMGRPPRHEGPAQ